LRSGPDESTLPLVDDLLVAGANPSAPILQAVSAITVARVLAQNGLLDKHPEVRAWLIDIASTTSRPGTYRVQALLTLAEADLLAAAYGNAERHARGAMALLESSSAVPLHGVRVTRPSALRGKVGAKSPDIARPRNPGGQDGRDHPLRISRLEPRGRAGAIETGSGRCRSSMPGCQRCACTGSASPGRARGIGTWRVAEAGQVSIGVGPIRRHVLLNGRRRPWHSH
jgi:hypothetical protein